MGGEQDPTSVVNFDFQVKGMNNLFIVDASVMPTLTSGNVNGPVLMLAEMASDIIKFKDFLLQQNCNIKDIFLPKVVC
ncbi:hypothetical protein NQ314_019076 [Rhamnusium bicolor]|uniref:Glucose-methanol-choline oxidoreductase C-terminal domain-containing protein n=1 Tax=Rhamnusium bicolor TaxID=1586634 RepID=A0AAV8WRH4_9CUCU|nr:hypothetical protein NQ314_019076 [Rhamnusium bicolor]